MSLAGAYNGLSFGTGTSYAVSILRGLYDLNDVRTNDLPVSVGGGYFAGNDRAGGRSIVLGLTIRGTSQSNFLTLADALADATEPQDDELPLQLLGNTIYVMARPRQREIPLDATIRQRSTLATVQFFCSTRTVHVGTPPP